MEHRSTLTNACDFQPQPVDPPKNSPKSPDSIHSSTSISRSQYTHNSSEGLAFSTHSQLPSSSLPQSRVDKNRHRDSASTGHSSNKSTRPRTSVGETKPPMSSTPYGAAPGLVRRASSGSNSLASIRTTKRISGPIFASASSGIDLTQVELEEQRRISLSGSRPSSLSLSGSASPVEPSADSSLTRRRGRLLSTAYEEDANPATPRHRDTSPILKSKFSQSPAPDPTLKSNIIPQRLDFLRKSFSDRGRPDADNLTKAVEGPRSASPTFSIKARTRKVLGVLNVNPIMRGGETTDTNPTTPVCSEYKQKKELSEEGRMRRFSANGVPGVNHTLKSPPPLPATNDRPSSAGHVPTTCPPKDKAVLPPKGTLSGKHSNEHLHNFKRAVCKSTTRLRKRLGSRPPPPEGERNIIPVPAEPSPNPTDQESPRHQDYSRSTGAADQQRPAFRDSSSTARVTTKRQLPLPQEWAGISTPGFASHEMQIPTALPKANDSPQLVNSMTVEMPPKPPQLRRLMLLARGSPKKAVQRPSFGWSAREAAKSKETVKPAASGRYGLSNSSPSFRSSWIDLADEVHFDGSTAANGKEKHSKTTWYRSWRPSGRGFAREERVSLASRPPPSSYRLQLGTQERNCFDPQFSASIETREQSSVPALGAARRHDQAVTGSIVAHRKPPPARPLILPTLQTRGPTVNVRDNAPEYLVGGDLPTRPSSSTRHSRRSEVSSISTIRQADIVRSSSKRSRPADIPPVNDTTASTGKLSSRRPIAPLPTSPNPRRTMGDSLPIPPRGGSNRARTRASTISSASSMDRSPRELGTDPTASTIGTSILFQDVELALSKLCLTERSPNSNTATDGSTPTSSAPTAARATSNTLQPSADEVRVAAILARLLCSQSQRSAAPTSNTAIPTDVAGHLASSEATRILSELVAHFGPSPLATPSRRSMRRVSNAPVRTPERRLQRNTAGMSSRGTLTPEQWRREETQRFSDATLANSILSYASTPVSSSAEDLSSLLEGLMDTSEGEMPTERDRTKDTHVFNGPVAMGRASATARKRKESDGPTDYFLSRAEREKAMSPIPEGGAVPPRNAIPTSRSPSSGIEAVSAILDLYQQLQGQPGMKSTTFSPGKGKAKNRSGSQVSTDTSPCPVARSIHSLRRGQNRSGVAAVRMGSGNSVKRVVPIGGNRVKKYGSPSDITRARQDSRTSTIRTSTEPEDTFSITSPAKQQIVGQNDILVHRMKSSTSAREIETFRELQQNPQRRLFQSPIPLTPPVSDKDAHLPTRPTPWVHTQRVHPLTLTPPDSSNRISEDLPPLESSALHRCFTPDKYTDFTSSPSSSSVKGNLFNLPSLIITDADVEAKCRSLSTTPAGEEKKKRQEKVTSPLPKSNVSPFRNGVTRSKRRISRGGKALVRGAPVEKAPLIRTSIDEAYQTAMSDSDTESSSSTSSSESEEEEKEEILQMTTTGTSSAAGNAASAPYLSHTQRVGSESECDEGLMREDDEEEGSRITFSLMSPLRKLDHTGWGEEK